MHKKLKSLIDQYKKGTLDKAAYETAVKKLLDDEYIEQDEYDEALDVDPEEGKPIYTQADVDGMIVKKATQLVRKTLKDAGIEVEAGNKELLPKVAELVKAGQADGGKATDKNLEELKKLQAKVPGLEAKVKSLGLTNTILAEAGKYNPYSTAQVVRALQLDYADLLDIDDESGEVDKASIAKAMKRLKTAEPNLFKGSSGTGDDDQDDNIDDQGGAFRGKGPGGSGTPSVKDKAYEAKKAQALEMLGIKKDK